MPALINNKIKKIILLISSFILLFTSCMLSPFVSSAHAQSEGGWYNQAFTDWYSKVYNTNISPPNEIFGERYTAAQVQWIFYSIASTPLNWLGRQNQEMVSCAVSKFGGILDFNDCINGNIEFIRDALNLLPFANISKSNNKSSAISPIKIVFNTDNREFSGIKHVKESLSRFGIVQTVKAQEGFGYGALGLVQPIWRVSRNFAYTFTIFFIIIFAFMIMFRVKISPQVVISVQSALPKVILAVILATFSFAIAGFVIDFMYVIIGVIAGFLDPLPWSLGFNVLYGWISGSSLGGAGLTTITSPILVLLYMLTYTVLFLVLILVSLLASFSTLSLFSAILSILMILLVVWLIILTFWYAIKIPWMLIKTLINIYMSVIIGPIQITLGAIAPKIGFGLWLRNLISNVMVFPFVGVMFLFAFLFLAYGFVSIPETIIERNLIMEIIGAIGFKFEGFIPGNLWSPPFLGSGAEITPLIFAMMSFGIIIAIPKATDILKAIIMGGKFEYGSAIGVATEPLRWAQRTAPVRAVGDIIGAEGAARALNSGWLRWIADKTGYGTELKSINERAKKRASTYG